MSFSELVFQDADITIPASGTSDVLQLRQRTLAAYFKDTINPFLSPVQSPDTHICHRLRCCCSAHSSQACCVALMQAVCGSLQVPYQGETLNLEQPFRRATMHELVQEALGMTTFLLIV